MIRGWCCWRSPVLTPRIITFLDQLIMQRVLNTPSVGENEHNVIPTEFHAGKQCPPSGVSSSDPASCIFSNARGFFNARNDSNVNGTIRPFPYQRIGSSHSTSTPENRHKMAMPSYGQQMYQQYQLFPSAHRQLRHFPDDPSVDDPGVDEESYTISDDSHTTGSPDQELLHTRLQDMPSEGKDESVSLLEHSVHQQHSFFKPESSHGSSSSDQRSDNSEAESDPRPESNRESPEQDKRMTIDPMMDQRTMENLLMNQRTSQTDTSSDDSTGEEEATKEEETTIDETTIDETTIDETTIDETNVEKRDITEEARRQGFVKKRSTINNEVILAMLKSVDKELVKPTASDMLPCIQADAKGNKMTASATSWTAVTPLTLDSEL
jgi:hypothetical protein